MSLKFVLTISGNRLHENLIEHLLSEICLGTITSLSTALDWQVFFSRRISDTILTTDKLRLHSTFLYVRLLKNPANYKVHPTSVMSADSILKGSTLI